MAWVSASLTADEVAAAAANCPMLIGTNILDRSTVPSEWRVSGSWASGADVTESGSPTRLAYDRIQKLPTRASVVGATEISLMFKLSPGSTPAASFDMVAILGHNFDLISNLTNVRVEIADDTAFSTRLQVVTAWTSFTKQRLIDVDINDGLTALQRFSAVDYLRVRCTASSAFTVLPKIGELICGRRRQLPFKANTPFLNQPLISESADFKSPSGNTVRHANFKGAANGAYSWTLGRFPGGTLEAEVQWRAFWDDIDHGEKPFLYIENPGAAPATALYVLADPPELKINTVGPLEEELAMGLIEIPPFLRSELI